MLNNPSSLALSLWKYELLERLAQVIQEETSMMKKMQGWVGHIRRQKHKFVP